MKQRSSKGDLHAKTVLPSEELEEPDLFIIDRRGDQKNVEYGSLHRYSIPTYHRSGAGYVVGLNHEKRIDRHESTDKAMVIRDHHRDQVKRWSKRPLAQKPKQHASKIRTLKIQAYIPNQGSLKDVPGLDFVAFSSTNTAKRKCPLETPETTYSDPDYRSIEGKQKVDPRPDDEDLGFASDSDVDTAEYDAQREARLRSAELFHQAKNNPKNIDAWKDLIAYQCWAVQAESDVGLPRLTMRRTVSDLRISIYDRALKHVTPSQAGHDELMVGLLSEGAMVWDFTKLSTRWLDALADHPKSQLLWVKYLDFLQSQFHGFGFTKCKDAYIDALQALDCSSGNSVESTDTERLYVFLRVSCFLRDAGFDELAVSLWQALLESAFFCPSELAHSRDQQLAALEEWWEADVPRIGEKDAIGWDAFYSGKDSSGRVSNGKSLEVPSDEFKTQLRIEAQAAHKTNLPAKADSDDEDDPFQYVMFSDMKPIVRPLLSDLPQRRILNACLRFFGLTSSPLAGSDECRAWAADPFLACTRAHTRRGSVSRATDTHIHWLQCQMYNSFELFEAQNFDNLEHNTVSFIRRLLDSVIQRTDQSEDELLEYYLAFVQRTSSVSTEARKIAKQMLRARPDSLRLYNAYALIEAHLDNFAKAANVWKTALTAGLEKNQRQGQCESVLWHSWFWTALYRRDEDEALGVLLSVGEGSLDVADVKAISPIHVTSSQRLRTRRLLHDQVDLMLAQRNTMSATLLIELSAWLNYMLSGYSISEALSQFDKYASRIESTSSDSMIENLLQAKAKIIIWHIERRRPYKPANLRSCLTNDLHRFPENSVLIEAWNLTRGSLNITDTLRQATESFNTYSEEHSEAGLVSWYNSISQAIWRFEIGAGSRHSVRNIFRSAILSLENKVKCSQVLWTTWLQFELSLCAKDPSMTSSHGTESKEHAKRVLHNGIQAMPWHKAWAIDAADEMLACGAIDETGVRTVLDLLEERGLRIRVQSLLGSAIN